MDNKELFTNKLLCTACLCAGRCLHKVADQRMQHYYLETLNEIPLCSVPQECPSLCWECMALLRKAVLFREQVKDSYRILQTYTSENLHECLVTDITRTPRFRTHHTDPVSIPPSAVPDEDLDLEGDMESTLDEKPSVQLICLKEESHDWSEDEIISNHDACTDMTDIEEEVENILGVKKEKERRKKSPITCPEDSDNIEKKMSNILKRNKIKLKKNTNLKGKNTKKTVKKLAENNKYKIPSKTVEGQKIITVELSYEEMLVEREKESKRESYVQSQYKCESCLLGFNYARSYEAHCKNKHSSRLGDYNCPICKTVIASVDSFTSHYKRHMRRYECSICQKRTLDLKVMQQHFYSSHQIQLQKYTCNVCGKISNSIDTHRYHRDSHKARVACPECDKTFSHRAGLLNHRLVVHELHNHFLCAVCGKTFRWKTSLKRHLEKHDTKNSVENPAAYCSPCGISFSSASSYQRHLRNSLKHVSQNQLRFICDPCGRRFADKTKLRDHIEEKHLHRTYQCHICSKPSKNRVGLDQHIRNVHRGRPHNKVCHYCGKAFPTKVQLESHLRTHTGERPFSCERCPTTFSQQSNLYKHTRQVHMNIKSKRYPTAKKRKEDNTEPPPPSQQFQQPLFYTPDRSVI